MSLLLDSSVLVQVLRKDAAAVSRLRDQVTPPLVSAISVDEIWFGAREKEVEATRALFEWLYVIPVGEPEARLSAQWRRDYAGRGVTLEMPDTLIAATASLRGATLATGNVKHFPMAEVHVERWPE